MKINIIKKSDKESGIEEVRIIPEVGREIIASNTSDSWNTKAINDFLIKISNHLADNDQLEIVSHPTLEQLNKSEETSFEDFKFIVKLFKVFAEEYNKEINNE